MTALLRAPLGGGRRKINTIINLIISAINNKQFVSSQVTLLLLLLFYECCSQHRFSQLTVLSSALCRIVRLPSNFVNIQEYTIWSMVTRLYEIVFTHGPALICSWALILGGEYNTRAFSSSGSWSGCNDPFRLTPNARLPSVGPAETSLKQLSNAHTHTPV